LLLSVTASMTSRGTACDRVQNGPTNWVLNTNGQSALCPGYRHVENFAEEEAEYEEGEEVFYVTLDMGDLHPTVLPTCSGYRLAGLDTEHPFIQLNDTIFMGEHHSLLGSEIVVEEARDESDPSRKFVRPMALTSQRIRFKEVYVNLAEDDDKAKENNSNLGAAEGAEGGMDAGGSDAPSSRGRGRGRPRSRGRGRGGAEGPSATATGRKRGRPRKSIGISSINLENQS